MERRIERVERAEVVKLSGATVASSAARPRGDSAVRTLAAEDLLGSSGLLRIDLDGEIYTLRLTRNRRLILTK